MTSQKFIEKVINERCVDTAKYRYVAEELPGKLVIKRLLLSDLDTTAALNDCEVVKTIELDQEAE